MGTALRFLLLSGVFIPRFIFSQSESVQGAPKPELSLRLQPENVVDGVPQAFTFVLTNVSDEVIYLPSPDLDCTNPTPRGALWLDESWQPPHGSTGLAKGQGFCDFGGTFPPPPPVVELAKTWRQLRSGESVFIDATADNLHYDSSREGVYRFSGTYIPPSLTREQLQLLAQAGINIPRQKAKTGVLQFLRSK